MLQRLESLLLFRRLLVLITASYAAFFSSPAFAAAKPAAKSASTQQPTFTLTPSVGGIALSEGGHVTPALLYGIKLGYDIEGHHIGDSIDIEGTFNYYSTLPKTGEAKTHGYLFRLDTLYPFTPGKEWVPFVAVGLGGISISKSTDSYAFDGQKNLLINYGGGVKYFIDNYLAVRLDLRHLLVYHDINTRNDVEASLGLTYLFGKEPRKKKPKGGKVTPPKAPAIPVLQDVDSLPGGKEGAAPGAAPAGTTPGAPQGAPAATPPAGGTPPTPPAGEPPAPGQTPAPAQLRTPPPGGGK